MKKFIVGLCSYLVQVGLSMGGYQNTYLSVFLFSIAGILIIWTLIQILPKVWIEKVAGSLTQSISTLGFIVVILVILSVILNSITVYKVLLWKPSEQSEKINESLKPDKIKDTIRRWLSAFGNGSMVMESPNDEFCLGVNLPSSLLLSIAKPKQYPQYISIRSSIVPSEEHLKLLKALPPKQIKQILFNLIIEIDRLHLESSHLFLKQIESPRPSIERIHLERRLPITNNLTEDVFIRAVNEMESDERLIAFVLLRDLEK